MASSGMTKQLDGLIAHHRVQYALRIEQLVFLMV
jgi:hypothetical protein